MQNSPEVFIGKVTVPYTCIGQQVKVYTIVNGIMQAKYDISKESCCALGDFSLLFGDIKYTINDVNRSISNSKLALNAKDTLN